MITIKPSVYTEYRITLAPIQTLDQSGELCQYCTGPEGVVEIQAYGRVMPELVHEVGELEFYAESCTACLGRALNVAGADPDHPITVEFETTNPVGPPAGTMAGAR